MKAFFKSLFLSSRFFTLFFSIAVLFIISYFYPGLYRIAQLFFYLLLCLLVIDIILLYKNRRGIQAHRNVPDRLSNGDENKITITLKNTYSFPGLIKVIDELPVQFQKRDFLKKVRMAPRKSKKIHYQVRPTERGEYTFGALNIFISTPLQLASRRQQVGSNLIVPTYPSFLQLKKYEFLAFTNRLKSYGFKKIRRIGHTLEFEQIKEYIPGDDVRTINWKATAKRHQIMVNQFQDEKSQPVYSVIDTGRVMKMPFNQLSLLDYAINATLVISGIALKKKDKAGMFTFSRKTGHLVAADRKKGQMQRIIETLYNIETDFSESDFARLYVDIKRNLKQRGLLLLYTNFETLDGLYRQLPYLQAIAKSQLLVVIFFENTELSQILDKPAVSTKQIFEKTIAEKFIYEKKHIVNELKKRGIYSILTKPESLTVDTINTYLEIKARGLL